ncbi:MAG: hypothetical protein EON87_06875 [Brevundimonas sp.]|nr:MAG: hypothetical protein EON87_06875 [Brevundimonas sp.]
MSLLLTAAMVLALGGQDRGPPATPDPDAANRLADVVISGESLKSQTEAFVAQLAAPPERRGLARWAGRVCVGAVNIRPDIAQAVIDRVSELALDLHLRIGDPGCTPNVVVIFTENAPALADAMVEHDPAAFHLGVGGLDRGRAALQTFRTSDAPVRWWHVSMPVIGASGQRAIRMPGDSEPIYVPGEGIVNRGRPISDNLNKVIIVLDVSKLGDVTLPQLTDYVGMVAMAQIDPEGETAAFDTVMNLFEDPQGTPGLSDWDALYLQALYNGPRERVNPDAQAADIARILRRASRAQERAERVTP